jgi:hypothetical protein
MSTLITSPLREQAKLYLSLGWKLCVIPRGSKGPKQHGWNKREHAITDIQALPLNSQGLGLMHAYSGTCCLDIDDMQKAQAYLVTMGVNLQQIISEYAPGVYKGRKDRLKVLFGLAEPLETVSRQDLGFELRCATADGLSVQDVLPPTVHPDTGEPYAWLKPPGEALPPLPAALHAVWLGLLAEKRCKPAKTFSADPLAAAALAVHDTPTVEQVRADLAVLSADCSYDQWRNVVWGVLATGLPEAEELARQWSLTAPERYNEAAFDNLVRSFQPKPGGITYGTVRHMADMARLPQPQPLPDALSPVLPFTPDLLPAKLRPWVIDIAERMGCPLDFVGVPAMVALGSVLGRKLAIRPQQRTDWAEMPNLWGLIVGRPGMLKSPAMQQALAPLRRLTLDANERYNKEHAEWRQAKQLSELRAEAGKKQARNALANNVAADVSALLYDSSEPEPTCKRYTVTNATPEALGELLRQNPQGLLLERDEIMGFLRDLDREDRADHRAFILETWAGNGAFTFDRIGRGFNLHIPAMCLSIIGTTQPGRLRAYVAGAVQGGAGDDGLMQRFSLMVWPDAPADWRNVDEWPDSQAKAQAWEVFRRLDQLTPETVGAKQDLAPDGQPDGLPYLRLDDAAHACFLAWRSNLETRLRGDLHPAIESHLAKYRKLVPALALILHLAEGNTGPVCQQAVEQAIAWAVYLESHAQRCYGAGIRAEVETARAILKRIKKGDLNREGFRSHDVWRPKWSGLTDRAQVVQALDYLAAMDWLIVESKATGGRDAKIYALNPKANL